MRGFARSLARSLVVRVGSRASDHHLALSAARAGKGRVTCPPFPNVVARGSWAVRAAKRAVHSPRRVESTYCTVVCE